MHIQKEIKYKLIHSTEASRIQMVKITMLTKEAKQIKRFLQVVTLESQM
jgi:hypothetical protein